MGALPPSKDIKTKYIFTQKEEKIIIAILNWRDDVQNKDSEKHKSTYLSDNIQRIRAKLKKHFDLSHDFVKKKVLYTEKVEGSRREIFRIELEWQGKIKPLLKTIQNEANRDN